MGKATMAEAHALETVVEHGTSGADEPPVMPHLYSRDRMDSEHPPLTAPSDEDGDQERLMDQCDRVFQHGMALARDIAERTMTQGRRRLERAPA